MFKALFGASAETKSSTSSKLNSEGLLLLNNANYTEALVYFEDALKSNPKCVDAHTNKGKALSGLERYKESLVCYDTALQLDPKFAAAYSGKAYSLNMLRHHLEALACWDSALKLTPKDVEIYRYKERCLGSLKNRKEDQLICLNNILKLDPQDYHALTKKARVFGELKRHLEALKCCDAALKLRPNEAFIFSLKSGNYNALERYEEALVCCDKALELDANHSLSLSYKIEALSCLERYQEALICYEALLKLKKLEFGGSELPFVYEQKGSLLIKLERYQEALVCFKNALNILPNFLMALCNQGFVLHKLKRYEEALESYDTLLKQDPTFDDAIKGKQQVLDELSKISTATSSFSNLSLASDGENKKTTEKTVSAFITEAEKLYNLGKYVDSLIYCERALKRQPKHALAHYYKALAFYNLERYQEALTCLDKALETDPKFVNAHYTKGNTLCYLKRYQEALACYEHVLKLDPEHAYALQGKKQVLARLSETATAITASFSSEDLLGEGESKKTKIKVKAETKPEAKSDLSVSFTIPYSELTFSKELGRGAFGVVYQGSWRFNEVAIKQLLASSTLSASAIDEFKTETHIMAKLRSPNIVQFYGCCVSPKYSIVMEYMPKGSLYSLLHSKQTLEWPVRYQIATDMACGLAFLHAEKILHLDLKSLNVLLDGQFRAKLSDFGLATIKTETRSTNDYYKVEGAVGTISWMAPELFKRKATYTQKADIYSLGVTFWEIAARKNPFADARDSSNIRAWVQEGEREEIPSDCPKKLASLIRFCWEDKPENRPTAAQVVKYLKSSANDFTQFVASEAPAEPAAYRGNLDSAGSAGAAGSGYVGNLGSATSFKRS